MGTESFARCGYAPYASPRNKPSSREKDALNHIATLFVGRQPTNFTDLEKSIYVELLNLGLIKCVYRIERT